MERPEARGKANEAGASAPAVRMAAAKRQAVGDFEAALRLLAQAVSLAPDDPEGWVALVACFLAARRPEEAVRAADAGLGRLPRASRLMVAKGRVVQSLSRVDEAAALYRQALMLDRGCLEARLGLASLALERGRIDEAEALIAPAGGVSPEARWLAIRIALERGGLEPARSQIVALLATDSLSPLRRADAELLLGEVLDGLGRPADAFQAFARGKQLQRAIYAERAPGREGEADKLDRLAAWLSSADSAPWRQAPPPTRSMTGGARGHAFLVGFPRSGTTLLEQALAGSRDLVSLEEAPTLAGAYDALMTSPAALQRLASLGGAEAEHWRAAYWAEVGRGGVDARGKLFLDKAPAGTLYLPLIAKLFPVARVLFAVRDPRDVALSCFRNNFQMNALTYAFTDLGETARCYGASMAMAEVYRRVLTLETLQVRYEALVANFPGELERIGAFLGLSVTPEMLDVAATARGRSVRTPSARQVRAGLNRAGLGRWRAYRRELAPVMAPLDPWVRAFGYDAGGSG